MPGPLALSTTAHGDVRLGSLLRTFLMVGLLATPAAAQVTSVEAFRSALPGAEFYSERFTPALAERILAGYGDTRQQSPEAVARLAAAFEGRFQGGTLNQGLTPGFGLETFALISPQGDLVARFFIPVVNLGGSQAEVEAGLRRYLQSIEAITGVSVGQSPSLVIEQIWDAGGFVRFPGQGGRSVYAWGVAPDFVEFTYSSLGDEACPFVPAKGFWARQTCP